MCVCVFKIVLCARSYTQAIKESDEIAVGYWIKEHDVNKELHGNKRALHLAAEANNPMIMSKLLDAGAGNLYIVTMCVL